jgi:hypothetical protein
LRHTPSADRADVHRANAGIPVPVDCRLQ